MTCKTECTQFDLAMELLIENGFEGLAVGLVTIAATHPLVRYNQFLSR